MPLLDSIKYPSNFITHITFKVDYDPILTFPRKPPPEFQKKIENEFPVCAEKITSSWSFSSADGKRQLTVSPTCLSLELFAYDHFKNFESMVKVVYDSFAGIYGQIITKGLSLRFVNTIVIPFGRPLDWRGLISESLTHVCDHFVWDKKEVSRCISQIVFDKDDHLILFNYGMHNDDYPAKISNKSYMLDIECATAEVTGNTVFQKLKDYHDEIQSLFESCIDEDLRVIMRKQSK